MHLRLMGGGEFIWIGFIDMKKVIEKNSIEMALFYYQCGYCMLIVSVVFLPLYWYFHVTNGLSFIYKGSEFVVCNNISRKD